MYSTASSSERQARKENVAGDFFVDKTCIDCDTCRWMAPDVFTRVGDMSAVTSQPTDVEGRQQALRALLSCPTASIHVQHKEKGELRAAQDGLPAPVPGCSGVYHCGYHSERSYAGTSYLIVRPGGNVLVDSPRHNPALAKRIKALGGACYMFLTHRDDVADHAQWAAELGCQRILHADEANRGQGTDAVEEQLQGEGPWRLSDGGEDIQIIHTPGHTSGSLSLYYAPDKALFTGDHLAMTSRLEPGQQVGPLSIFRRYNWHSVPRQLASVHKLLDIDFLHLLPAHGRMAHFADGAERAAQINALLAAEGFGF